VRFVVGWSAHHRLLVLLADASAVLFDDVDASQGGSWGRQEAAQGRARGGGEAGQWRKNSAPADGSDAPPGRFDRRRVDRAPVFRGRSGVDR
jgi:hypothetical protein